MSSQQPRFASAPGRAQSLLPPPFHCATAPEGPRAVRVEAAGELDLLSAPELEQALRVAARSAQLVVLDLHSLTFIDSSGVHAIEDASLRALLHGKRLVVSRAPAHVARILTLARTATTVEVLDYAAA